MSSKFSLMKGISILKLSIGLCIGHGFVFAYQDVETNSGEPISPKLISLELELQSGRREALKRFWEEVAVQGTPLVEPTPDKPNYSYVTFVWKDSGNTQSVLISTFDQKEITNKDYLARSQMARLSDTDIWFITYRLRNDSRFTYQISPNDPMTLLSDIKQEEWDKRKALFRPDPFNTKHFKNRNGETSVVELPAAPPQPWIHRMPGVPVGNVEEYTIRSTILNNERKILVYTPKSYDPNGPRNHLLVFLDGETYFDEVPAPTILDNLEATGKLPPVVAVFVGNGEGQRGAELFYGELFQDFLAKELVPWVRLHYRVTTDPSGCVVVGKSLGGSAAMFTGFRHSEIFGNVLSQSGGYMVPQKRREPFKLPLPGQLIFDEDFPENEWLTREFVKHPKLPLTIYFEVGLREEADWQFPIQPFAYPSIVAANRHLRDVLEAKGYVIHYHEFNGGHETISWRGTLADGLIDLIGKAP